MQILIVDDDVSTRKLLSKYLTQIGYETIEAENGKDALNQIAEREIHFVLSDWMMPELDGINLCKQIRSSTNNEYIYFIMVTGKDDKTALVQGMEAGADDFIHKPVNRKELQVRIRAGQRILDLQQSLLEKNHCLTKAQNIIEQDLKTASKIQQTLLPKHSILIYGLKFESMLEAGAYVAGDTFNFFTIDDHNVGFYLLDVSGHGVTSALLSLSLNKKLLPFPLTGSPLKTPKNEAPYYEVIPPAKVASYLNESFFRKDYCEQYFTMLYCVYNTTTNEIKFCQAGHPPLIHIHRDNVKIIGEGGFPIGLIPDVDYKESSFKLETNDRVILYSDGITECKNKTGQLFGEHRLLSLIKKHKHLELNKLILEIHTNIKKWHCKDKFEDDISIVALERQY